MKKVINVFLTIIMACVVVLLVISLSIRTISTKTISNAFFEEEVSNNMKEVLANTFPDVSSENIDVLENVIKDNEAINEVANDLLNHISDSISSGNKVDSDYFNSDNEGHIFIKITNDSNENKTVELNAGQGFAQGIFMPFGLVEDDDTTDQRNGGFGSTTK